MEFICSLISNRPILAHTQNLTIAIGVGFYRRRADVDNVAKMDRVR